MADTYVVERSLTINASPELLFEQVANLRNWSGWSPWDKRDPSMAKTYEGTEGAVGSTYSWKGNSKVGQGKMTITQADAPSEVTLDLHFLKPFKSTSSSRFSFSSEAGGTKVVWTMTGQHNWLSKVMGVFIKMDKMLGKDFEQGLSNLKSVTEA